MGIFDSLIDEGLQPKDGMEYIYNFDTAWPLKPASSSFDDYAITVEIGIIVIDVIVVQNEAGNHMGYDFTIKETGQRCHCNYPYVFWENTPENKVKIEIYNIEKQKLKDQQKVVDALRAEIDSLQKT